MLLFSSPDVCASVCVCFRNTSRRSVSLRSACLRTTTSPTRPSCTDRPSRVGRGTSGSTEMDRSWKETAWRRRREPHTSCPNSLKVQQININCTSCSRGRDQWVFLCKMLNCVNVLGAKCCSMFGGGSFSCRYSSFLYLFSRGCLCCLYQ